MQLLFVVSPQGVEYLSLFPAYEEGRNHDWHVVTGAVETGESLRDAVRREAAEETGLEVIQAVDLHAHLKYVDSILGIHVDEHLYGARAVETGGISLNEEHVDYKWTNRAEFVRAVWREGDREELMRLINLIDKAFG